MYIERNYDMKVTLDAMLPQGQYEVLYCHQDANRNQTLDRGEKYQILYGPLNLQQGENSLKIDSWVTY
jgi:hypothetical protein